MEQNREILKVLLQQVDDLFGAIAKLPPEIRGDAVKSVRDRLHNLAESTTTDRQSNNDASTESVPSTRKGPQNITSTGTNAKESKKRGRKKANPENVKAIAERPVRKKRPKQMTDYEYVSPDKELVKNVSCSNALINTEVTNEANSKTEDENAAKVNAKTYSCASCDRKFVTENHLRVHTRMHTGERPFKCEICSRAFTQRGGLKIHMKRHNGVLEHACKHCNYKSVGKIDMVRHMARHTGERNYSCEICGKRFATDVTIKDHIKHVHQRKETYICQICGFVTHRHDNLRRHVVVRHSNTEFFQCPVCSQVVKQRSSFIIHMRTHTGERPHKCPKCNKCFKSQSQVAAHLRSHVDGTFQCHDCKRLFKTKFHLRRHSLVHTGEKPYSCMYCSYSCNVKGNINKHVRAVHGIEDFSFKKVDESEKTPSNKDELQVDTEKAKEKGNEAATEFLTQLSLRKDEQLTVKDLQLQLEEKRRQEVVEKCGRILAVNKAALKNGLAKHSSKASSKVRKASVGNVGRDSDEVIESKEVQIVISDDFEGAELIETTIDGQTVVLPSTGFICLRQTDDDDSTTDIQLPIPVIASDEVNAPTMVYLIQCTDEKELDETFVTQ